MELLMHASAKRWFIPFWSARANSEGSQFWRMQNPPKLIGYHGNIPWTITKPTSVL